VRTRVRELFGVVKGLLSTRHPLLMHIIPIRRCNLACTYCNERFLADEKLIRAGTRNRVLQVATGLNNMDVWS
jgi:hypothetical protein